MVLDGYDEPITMSVELKIAADGILADFEGTSPVSRYGINVPTPRHTPATASSARWRRRFPTTPLHWRLSTLSRPQAAS
jgi:N-methylhydantoinase B/oxoprolinase/acetone carboxylase alpha subunit